MRVKITVLKTEFYPELADTFLTEGRAAGPCPDLRTRDVFIYEGGAVMPKGFCPYAWTDIYREVSVAFAAGCNPNPWYKKPGIAVTCCQDGVRPVIFSLEPVE